LKTLQCNSRNDTLVLKACYQLAQHDLVSLVTGLEYIVID